MKTTLSLEPFFKPLALAGHHVASSVIRSRFRASPIPPQSYGAALSSRNAVMLRILAGKTQAFTLVANERLDPADPLHATHRMRLTGEGSYSYTPGDMAYLRWKNDPRRVQAILNLYGADPETKVRIATSSSMYVPGWQETMTLGAALATRVELLEACPALLKKAGLSSILRHNAHQDRLHHAYHKQADRLGGLSFDHPHLEYRTVDLLSVLTRLGSKRPSLPGLLRMQGRINARCYTISDFMQTTEKQFRLDLTVSQVERETLQADLGSVSGPARSASFLQRSHPGEIIEGWIIPDVHRFPCDLQRDTPLLAICTGSGISGVMALLRTRSPKQVWLVYGVRSWASKHLYGNELERFFESGTITRLDAVSSRPQDGEGPAQRVQDRLWDQRIDVAAALKAGAGLYISGRLSMGYAVLAVLCRILVDQGLSPDTTQARATLSTWHRDLRLLFSVSGV